jgi:hypothetical protein
MRLRVVNARRKLTSHVAATCLFALLVAGCCRDDKVIVVTATPGSLSTTPRATPTLSDSEAAFIEQVSTQEAQPTNTAFIPTTAPTKLPPVVTDETPDITPILLPTEAPPSVFPRIDGTWAVTVTVTAGQGEHAPLGSAYSRIWVITVAECPEDRDYFPGGGGCAASLVSSSGNAFSGWYFPQGYGRYIGRPSILVSKASREPCYRAEIIEAEITASLNSGGITRAISMAGITDRQQNYPNASDPPPGCAFSAERGAIAATRSE